MKNINFYLTRLNPIKLKRQIKKVNIKESVYKAYNSKVVLQEIVLAIVEYFKDFPKIYFPVRLD